MTTMSLTTTDLHVHLYGALPASDLFEIGCQSHKKFSKRLAWYEEEYQKAFGQKPETTQWWHSPDGVSLLEDHLTLRRKATFEEFQAKFNLVIALNPPNPGELTLATRVLTHDAKAGGLREYRTFLPHYLAPLERESYLKNLLVLCHEFNGNDYKPRLALSIPRDEALSFEISHWLDGFLERHQDISRYVTGIDFCGSEAHHPPSSKRDFLRDWRSAKNSRPVLYHVGETWSYQGPFHALRWVVEAANMGFERLGHCTILGITPSSLLGQSYSEPSQENQAMLDWLKASNAGLTASGLERIHYDWLVERYQHPRDQALIVDHDTNPHFAAFQDACLVMVSQSKAVIECLPTSNLRLSCLRSFCEHPIFRFFKEGIPFVIGSDDPEIFQSTLQNEWDVVQRCEGFTPDLGLWVSECTRGVLDNFY